MTGAVTGHVDGGLVRRRRMELGISRRSLGAALGTGAAGLVVARLEDGHDTNLTVAQLRHLARALAVGPADLLAGTGPETVFQVTGVETGADARTLGAVLHRRTALTPTADLAAATGWTTDRVRDALTLLATLLEPAGLRIHTLKGAHRIVAAEHGQPESDALADLGRSRTGTSLTETRLLALAVQGRLRRRTVKAADLPALQTLLNNGLVVTTDDRDLLAPGASVLDAVTPTGR